MALSEVRNTETYHLSSFRLVKDDDGNFGVRAIGDIPTTYANSIYSDTVPLFVPYSEEWFDDIINKYEDTLNWKLSKICEFDLENLAEFTEDDWDNGDEPYWDVSSIENYSDGVEAEVDFMMTRLKDKDYIENFTDPSEGRYYYEYRLYSFPDVSISVDFGVL